jgi:hypothetical protein
VLPARAAEQREDRDAEAATQAAAGAGAHLRKASMIA